uniref:NR LBD domain-containing protein n=2 Tax=Caenorhabditis tropicalis TaxID=1561998 RepID=A0A1I7SZN3_9PELO
MNPSFACLNEESVGDQYKGMPILEKMKMSYEKLEELRKELHRSNEDNISEERIPRSLKFQECLNQLSKETQLLADWIECCFDEFHTLAVDQKSLLFSNFLPVFIIFERTFMTSKFGKKNQLLLSSGDFVEIDKLEKFFTDEEKGICGKQMAELFQSSVKLYDTLYNLLSTENLDLFEFFTLTVLLLWDHGLVGQSEECMSSSKRMKSVIAKEYTHYQKYFKNKDNPTTEIAVKVPILTCLQRVSNRLRGDMSVSHVFDYFTMPENAISTFVGRYS